MSRWITVMSIEVGLRCRRTRRCTSRGSRSVLARPYRPPRFAGKTSSAQPRRPPAVRPAGRAASARLFRLLRPSPGCRSGGCRSPATCSARRITCQVWFSSWPSHARFQVWRVAWPRDRSEGPRWTSGLPWRPRRRRKKAGWKIWSCGLLTPTTRAWPEARWGWSVRSRPCCRWHFSALAATSGFSSTTRPASATAAAACSGAASRRASALPEAVEEAGDRKWAPRLPTSARGPAGSSSCRSQTCTAGPLRRDLSGPRFGPRTDFPGTKGDWSNLRPGSDPLPEKIGLVPGSGFSVFGCNDCHTHVWKVKKLFIKRSIGQMLVMFLAGWQIRNKHRTLAVPVTIGPCNGGRVTLSINLNHIGLWQWH